jgi:hypothetical protein
LFKILPNPPLEKEGMLAIARSSLAMFCHSMLGECVAILLCHYETSLRRRGNPICSVAHEIASVILLPPKKLPRPWREGIEGRG